MVLLACVNAALAWPHVEIVAVLVTSMGLLDVSLGVLASWSTAWGWKLLAALEVVLVVLFVRWFLRQGCSFLERTRWVPSLNVSQMKLFQQLDLDHDGTLSLDEIKAGRKQLGLTEEQAVALYEQLDANSDGVVTTDEFAAMYRNEQVSEQKHGATCRQRIALSTFTLDLPLCNR